jgi:hypothetical protein
VSETVTIGNRTFRIGATYAPKPGRGVISYRRKTLLRYRPELVWPFTGPSVQWANKNGSTEWANATAWLKWVGDEVSA